MNFQGQQEYLFFCFMRSVEQHAVLSFYISYRGFYSARRGRRVLPVTLGRHHTPFGSARTARAFRRSVPSIWSECSTHFGAQNAVGRAKKASIRIVERYATGTTSVFYGAREA